MKESLFIATFCFAAIVTNGQDIKGLNEGEFLRSSSSRACGCIDSISIADKSSDEISKDISNCIDKEVVTFQLTSKMLGTLNLEKILTDKKPGKKDKGNVEININTDKDSKEYKEYYYKLERFMRDSCSAMKKAIATNEKRHARSASDIPEAIDYYNKGIKDMEQKDYQKAVANFEAAVKIDPMFAFAWDNLGLSYRKLDNYDKALEAYNSSLKVDPNGVTPLQNIAVVYEYKKQYDKAIIAYEKLEKLDKNNPEIYYGIGRIYIIYLEDYENGLQNLCKAYNIYTDQKSPYRTDAESLISIVYGKMKKEGKEKRFNEILKENNITPN